MAIVLTLSNPRDTLCRINLQHYTNSNPLKSLNQKHQAIIVRENVPSHAFELPLATIEPQVTYSAIQITY